MQKRITANGHITNGKLFIHREEDFYKGVALLKAGSCTIRVESGTKRTTGFNNYHFGACQYVAEKLATMGCEGWTSEDVHFYSVNEINSVLKPVVNIATGEITQTPIAQGTRDMTTSEFMEFRAKFTQLWAEKGIAISDEYWDDSADA